MVALSWLDMLQHTRARQSDENTSKATKNTGEAKQLIETGFEYVCTTPDEVMLFRKRK